MQYFQPHFFETPLNNYFESRVTHLPDDVRCVAGEQVTLIMRKPGANRPLAEFYQCFIGRLFTSVINKGTAGDIGLDLGGVETAIARLAKLTHVQTFPKITSNLYAVYYDIKNSLWISYIGSLQEMKSGLDTKNGYSTFKCSVAIQFNNVLSKQLNLGLIQF